MAGSMNVTKTKKAETKKLTTITKKTFTPHRLLIRGGHGRNIDTSKADNWEGESGWLFRSPCGVFVVHDYEVHAEGEGEVLDDQAAVRWLLENDFDPRDLVVGDEDSIESVIGEVLDELEV